MYIYIDDAEEPGAGAIRLYISFRTLQALIALNAIFICVLADQNVRRAAVAPVYPGI